MPPCSEDETVLGGRGELVAFEIEPAQSLVAACDGPRFVFIPPAPPVYCCCCCEDCEVRVAVGLVAPALLCPLDIFLG